MVDDDGIDHCKDDAIDDTENVKAVRKKNGDDVGDVKSM